MLLVVMGDVGVKKKKKIGEETQPENGCEGAGSSSSSSGSNSSIIVIMSSSNRIIIIIIITTTITIITTITTTTTIHATLSHAISPSATAHTHHLYEHKTITHVAAREQWQQLHDG